MSTRIVPPGSKPGQGDLFPYLSTETALAFLRRRERVLLDVGPFLTNAQLADVLGEEALTDLRLAGFVADVRLSRAYRHARAVVSQVPTIWHSTRAVV